jgi:hypothetical protein
MGARVPRLSARDSATALLGRPVSVNSSRLVPLGSGSMVTSHQPVGMRHLR